MIKLLKIKKIPPMTDPLSVHWKQPNPDNIIIDNKSALMSEKDFKLLPDYSLSRPTGLYQGKMWKSEFTNGWFLAFVVSDPNDANYVFTFWREILIVKENENEQTEKEQSKDTFLLQV